MNILFLNQVAGGWSEAIWRASWQGGLAIVLVWILTKGWQTMPPLLRCWLWRFVFIKFALAFFCPIALELAWLPAKQQPLISREPDFLTTTLSTNSSNEPDPVPNVADVDSLAQRPQASTRLILLWLGGVGIYIVRLQRRWWATRHLRQAAKAVESSEVLHTVARLCG
jgi:hypothetical protein